ncbi:hypothetical protein [Corynebacterium aquilae]|uniref:Uncharacterized protein n=1 Tax=Corynebacterium aquilae DSM 44791 TaxID=1431546 RepID=A0A1L7CGS2_9CORY|nr:hypothetical protein [Corynebacterium aquilae]APT85061.1 hypothetical protein CAQU_08235 [Corynebacterium aquilae DSM 44791]
METTSSQATTEPPRATTRHHMGATGRALGRTGASLAAAYLVLALIWGLTIAPVDTDGTYVAFDGVNWPDVRAWFIFVIATGTLGVFTGPYVGMKPIFAHNPATIFLMGVYTTGLTALAWFLGSFISAQRYPAPPGDQPGQVSSIMFIEPGMALAFAPAMACLSLWIYLAIRYIQDRPGHHTTHHHSEEPAPSTPN